MRTAHCGVYCRLRPDGTRYHYHSGTKRKHNSYRSRSTRDPEFGRVREGDRVSRGAVRAAERERGW